MRGRRTVLEAIARRAGFRDVAFVYEPIAAAHHYEQTVRSEELVLIADIGGGTSDFSIIRVGPQHRERADRRQDVLATAGVRVGGTDFDTALSLAAVMPLLGLGTQLVEKNLPMPNALYHELATWATINFAYTYRNERELAELVSLACEPGESGASSERGAPTARPSPGLCRGGRQDRAERRGTRGRASNLSRGGPRDHGDTRRFRPRHRSQDRPAAQGGERLYRGGGPRRRRHRYDLSHGRVEPRAGRARRDRAGGPVRPSGRRLGSPVRRAGADGDGGDHDLSVEACRLSETRTWKRRDRGPAVRLKSRLAPDQRCFSTFSAVDASKAPGFSTNRSLMTAVLDDHGVALAAHAEAVLGQVHRQAHGVGELAVAVAQHHHLVARLLVLAPGAHHECVVDGNAGDGVDALRLDPRCFGQKTWHVLCADKWG